MGSRLDKNSASVRKNIENHDFDNEEGEEYEGSKFGGFPEYFRRKKIKLQNLDVQLRAQNHDKPKIFRGIVAHVNGYTQPSLNDLHILIVKHGGGFMQYLDGKTQVTHIVASNLTPKKVEEFKKYRIVKPAWIVESVNAGRLLPWENYRVVDEGVRQKLIRFDESGITSQTNDRQLGYRDQTDTSWYTKQLAEDNTTARGSSTVDVNDEFDFPSSAVISDYNGTSQASDGASGNHHSKGSSTHSSSELQATADVGFSRNVSASNAQTVSPDPITKSRNGEETTKTAVGPATSLDEDMHDARDDEDVSEVIYEPQPLPVVEKEVPAKRKNDEPSHLPEKRAKMTAEDHNRELLADPRIRQSSVLNPNFLEQYYRESRLHHLSTWKADLKAQLQALTAEKSASQKARQKRIPNARRYILHVDFDSFFVAVSLKKLPHLQEKPAVVAHGAGSGSEIASCNYAARKFGVKNGMWMKRAQEMCDDLKVLPYDFPAYEEASRLFYDAIMDTGGIVQSVSIDEALVDVSIYCHAAGGTEGTGVREGSIWREQAKADEIAQGLRDRVKKESGCAVSVGIGGNILLAKVALRKAKPAGQYHIKPEEVLDFLAELEVQSLPGIAYNIGGKLEEIGIKFVKDIRQVTKERLTSVLGPKTGEKIWNYSRGIDRTEVGDVVTRKSVSAEVNWGVRFETQEQVEEFMGSLSGELSRRLLKEGVKGRNLTMKVMRRAKDAPLDPPKHLGHGKCDIHNKSVVLGVLTNDRDMILKEVLSIIRGFGFSPGELRGLGIQMTKLEPSKTVTPGKFDGSQRRLQFGAVQGPSGPPSDTNTEKLQAQKPPRAFIQKDTPIAEQEASRPGSQFMFDKSPAEATKDTEVAVDDIQDGPETPRRVRSTAVNTLAHLMTDSPSRKPLNISGTQFVLPSQVDPKVLAELPPDIRSRLSKHTGAPKEKPMDVQQDPSSPTTRDHPIALTALPSETQLDLSILDALPEDVRKEVMSQYSKKPPPMPASRGQAVLPQSPRKNRTVRGKATARGSTRGRPRGGSLLARLRGASTRDSTHTLTQANFVSNPTDSESETAAADISSEFLEALPEDIRAEVIENHKRDKLRRNAGIEFSRRRQRLQKSFRDNRGIPGKKFERLVRLPARPQKPAFTQQKLTAPSELRDAVSSWVEEFLNEGPYEEDTTALCTYLRSVVVDEKDMRKAVVVVSWLLHITEDHLQGTSETGSHRVSQSASTISWDRAVSMVKVAVNDAVRSRGLGAVDFE